MDDLLKIAQQTMENFDPSVDKVDDFEEVADGEYTCLLEKATSKSNEKGTNWVSLDFSILDGENENRHIFVNYFFTEKTVERSIKAINKLAYDFGYELPVEAFESYETLADTLNGMAGNQAIVTKKTSSSGYTNYKVAPVE